MILVTGGTGTVGRALVAALGRERAAFRVLSRDVERARARLGDVAVVAGDLGQPATLPAALAGVDAVFLLTAPGPTIPAHDQALVDAAKQAGVRKIVKLSSYGAAETTLHSSRWHRAGEEALLRSGLVHVLLRPGAFSANALAWAPLIRAGRPIRVATGQGRHGVIDLRDLAEIAARALTRDALDGQALTLTGPAAITVGEQVATVGRALGRVLPVDDITPEQMGEALRAAGMPDGYVDAVIEGQRFMRDDGAAALTDDAARALGRPPRPFAEWVRDHLDAFR